MSQIEIAKLAQMVALGPPTAGITIPKLVMYAVLVPGESDGEEPTRQGSVYSQKIARN